MLCLMDGGDTVLYFMVAGASVVEGTHGSCLLVIVGPGSRDGTESGDKV